MPLSVILWEALGSRERVTARDLRNRCLSMQNRFMATFDYEASNGLIVKKYASYPACKDFIAKTLCKTEVKYFYKLIPEAEPCKLYLDVEQTGSPDPEKASSQVVHHLVKVLSSYTHVRTPIIACLLAGKVCQTIWEKPQIL